MKYLSQQSPSIELEIVMIGMSFDIAFEDEFFSKAEIHDITKFVKGIDVIPIDKTYVERKDSNFNDVFLIEEGWNEFCSLMMETDFCSRLHPRNQETIVDAFMTMARCYVYSCLSLYWKDKVEHMIVSVKQNSNFDVIVCKDVSNEWARYPGKWQKWLGKKAKTKKSLNK